MLGRQFGQREFYPTDERAFPLLLVPRVEFEPAPKVFEGLFAIQVSNQMSVNF